MNKFSIHLIAKNIIFDDQVISGLSYALEFNAYLNQAFQESGDYSNLHNIVDSAVYMRDQLFRTVGSHKRPLPPYVPEMQPRLFHSIAYIVDLLLPVIWKAS